MYDKRFDFSIIDICRLRKALEGEMHWETSEKRCNNKSLIEDFILLCFLVGNDFLPHIPSIENYREWYSVDPGVLSENSRGSWTFCRLE